MGEEGGNKANNSSGNGKMPSAIDRAIATFNPLL